MEDHKLLKGIAILVSLSLSSVYANDVIGSSNDISVSIHRDNLIQETLTVKNISNTAIENLQVSALADSGNIIQNLQLNPGKNISCLGLSKQNPLNPNQACTFSVKNAESKSTVKLMPGTLDIAVNNDGNPLHLKINAGSVLYAGGDFTGDPNSTQYNHIAYWDGTNWLPITQNVVNGVNGNVYALAYDPINKCIVVGGAFSQVGQTTANNIARYCGSQGGSAIWQTMSTGTNGPVHAIKFYNTDSPYFGYFIGGAFSQAGGINTNNIVYDAIYSQKPDVFVDFGGVNFEVDAIDTAYHNSDIYPDIFITGLNAGAPYNGVAQFNFDGDYEVNPDFVPVGTGLNGNGMAILAKDAGPTIVSGNFTQAGAVAVNSIAQFNSDQDNQWTDPFKFPSKSSNNTLNSLTNLQNSMFVTGDFQLPDNSYEIAQWNGSSWYGVGGGVHWSVNTQCSAVDASNNLYIGGQFKMVGILVSARDVAMWDGNKWYRLGTGLPPVVKSLLIAPYLSVSKVD